jgi:hypothetical protein
MEYIITAAFLLAVIVSALWSPALDGNQNWRGLPKS